MTKHFKIIHKETKEEIEFGLEDLYTGAILPNSSAIGLLKTFINIEKYYPFTKATFNAKVMDDYEVFYQHQGEWFKYE